MKPIHPSLGIQRSLIALLFFHLIMWTLTPILIRYNLPMDALEGATWGKQLEWGYDKNPFLNGWLTHLALYLDQYSGLLVYFFSQLSVIICMCTVWVLGNKILNPFFAVIAVMLLEGNKYFHLHAIDFNDNTLELSLWGLIIYFFYQATHPSTTSNHSRLKAWLYTGLFSGLGMMAKYYTAILLAALFLFLIINKEARKEFASPRPYLGLLIFSGIILPHVIWLFFHDFITIQYVFDRTSTTPSWKNHFFYPIQFAIDQFLAFLPVLFLFAILWVGKRNTNAVKPYQNVFNEQFLLFAGVGPFLLTLSLSFLFGIKLRAGWGMPLLSLWTLLLLYYFTPTVTVIKTKRFIASVFFLSIMLLVGYSYILIYSSTPSSANFPGKKIAQTLTQNWHHHYHAKLQYVAGPRWTSGNIGFYSVDHPTVFMEWNAKRAPWIDINQMKKAGAIFVWDITNNENLPAEVSAMFPTLVEQPPLEFQWIRTTHLKSIKIGYAFLPPETALGLPTA